MGCLFLQASAVSFERYDNELVKCFGAMAVNRVFFEMENCMNIWSHMEGYDRELDENEFDQKLWDAIREEEFEFDEQFEDYLHAYGFNNVHDFLKVIRRKKMMGILHD